MKQDINLFMQLLAGIVADETTHQDYDRVTKLADMYYAFITGEGLDDMMKTFAMRETPEAFDQRKAITEHIIPSVVSNITSVERKVPRSNGLTRVVAYKDDEKNKRSEELEKILDVFWGNMSFDDWMATRWIELNDLDPNTFAIVEWKSFDANKEKAAPYPYESKSHGAVMYEYINNILQYLVDKKDSLYTMYLMNQTIQAVLLEEDSEFYGLAKSSATEKGVVVEVGGHYFFKKNDKVYYEIIVFIPHNLDRVPAFRVGYKRDDVTDGRSYVSPYQEAVPYLLKTLKTNSELDLTMALHAFPQKIVTANKCNNPICYEGYVKAEGDGGSMKCGQCQGSGFQVHTSAQDIIYIPIPRGKDEQLSLDNLAHYITPETALLEFQRSYVEYLTNECMQAVFNSDIFTKEDIATTATEKTIDLDNIYDTLYPLSLRFAELWEYGVNLVAEITSSHKNLIVSLNFSKDFKFKSKDDYIRDRKSAQEAGAPDVILRNIDDEIIRIDTANNPHEYQIYRTVQSFDPFSGKTDEEIISAMMSNTVPFHVKVLYDNLGWIFDDIFLEHPDFFQMQRKKQVEIVDKKVQEIMLELDVGTEMPTGALGEGNVSSAAETGEEVDLEKEAKAKLRGTVGGVQGILQINEAVQKGLMDKDSAISLLIEIYGFDRSVALQLVKEPSKKKLIQTAEVNVPKPSPNEAPVN